VRAQAVAKNLNRVVVPGLECGSHFKISKKNKIKKN
jgi:hypothetical protein